MRDERAEMFFVGGLGVMGDKCFGTDEISRFFVQTTLYQSNNVISYIFIYI